MKKIKVKKKRKVKVAVFRNEIRLRPTKFQVNQKTGKITLNFTPKKGTRIQIVREGRV